MKKIKLGLFIMFVLVIYILNFNINSKYGEQVSIDDELNLDFTMEDIEDFNSFKSGKDISIKVELNYNGDIHQVKIKNISKDNNLAFTLDTGNDFKIYEREVYEFYSIENNDLKDYIDLYDLISKQDIYSPEIYIVNISINTMNYGNFFMKQSYDENLLKENNLNDCLIFNTYKTNGALKTQLIYDGLVKYDKKTLESLQIEDNKELINYFDKKYIDKINNLANEISLGDDFFISDKTVYLYRKDNNKIYPIIDPFELYKNYKVQLKDFKKDSKTPIIEKSTQLEKETNVLENLMIGDTKANIDYDNKVIFVSLNKESNTLQKISYKFSNYPIDIFINSSLSGEKLIWSKIEDGEKYDFQKFIYNGKLSYTSSGGRNVFDLYVTTGDVPLIEISTKNSNGQVNEIDISDKIPCNIKVLSNMDEEYNNKTIKGQIELSGKIINDKKNYSIKMDKKYKLEGMIASKDWILDGSAFDISLMRKKLTYDILREIYEKEDIKINIPEVRYVEVIINDEYQGLYTLSNKIDGDLLNLDDFKSFENYHDLLYKSVNINGKFTDENMDRSFYDKEYKNFPNGLQPKSKEIDPIYGWHSGYEQKWPDVDEYGEYWDPLETLIKTISLSSEDEFENIFSIVDREKFINLWILMLLQNNLNGTDNGSYVVLDGKENGKWYFIPWETNSVFGIDKEMNRVEYNTYTSDYLFDKCMKIDDFKNDFIAKWEDLLTKEIISVENFRNHIENNLETINDSQKRNYEKWPIKGIENFYDEIEYLQKWIKERISWLNTNYHKEEINEK